MNLDPAAILQTIIEHEGSCEWASPAICKRCPLGNKRVNGRRVNCWDYVRSLCSVNYGDAERIAETYKACAEEELFTLELEQALK
jgi:hypothetical protein